MKHLDLFSGIGGFALAARWAGWETVGFCEIDKWCQKALRKHWPDVPIHGDVKELSSETIGPVDIITGGYPCQPFSVAGKRRGAEDNRHVWPEAFRLVRELRPAYAVFENVAGHISMGLDEVLSDLESENYTTESFVIPACAVDAPHRRDRIWIVANANIGRRGGAEGGQVQQSRRTETVGASKDVAYTSSQGLEGWQETGSPGEKRERGNEQLERCGDSEGATWLPEPGVGRVANGIPRRVDRLKGLGNAIVPQVAHVIFEAINELQATS